MFFFLVYMQVVLMYFYSCRILVHHPVVARTPQSLTHSLQARKRVLSAVEGEEGEEGVKGVGPVEEEEERRAMWKVKKGEEEEEEEEAGQPSLGDQVVSAKKIQRDFNPSETTGKKE